MTRIWKQINAAAVITSAGVSLHTPSSREVERNGGGAREREICEISALIPAQDNFRLIKKHSSSVSANKGDTDRDGGSHKRDAPLAPLGFHFIFN